MDTVVSVRLAWDLVLDLLLLLVSNWEIEGLDCLWLSVLLRDEKFSVVKGNK